MKKSLVIALLLVAAPSLALAQGSTRLSNICRIKGQEENVLRGIGLVVGLNGTGESNDIATMRALSRAMELMGNPVTSTGRFDQDAQQALRNVKNVSLAMVTATVPAAGARRGDKLNCSVSALNGKSLAGGRLAFAALQGPNTLDPTVFALCQGPLHVTDASQPMVATIHDGCQMEQDVQNKFYSDEGWVTIVLDKHHADFVVAESVADQIAVKYAENLTLGEQVSDELIRLEYVKAIDAANIMVRIPERHLKDPVHFVSGLMETRVYDAEPEARVVCDTRTGTVAISGDVEIGDVVFTHQNLVVETNPTASFSPVAPGESDRPKLDRLIEALENLKVPAADKIEIIRNIDRLGKLHANLIIL